MSRTASTVSNSLFTVFGMVDKTSSIIRNPSNLLNGVVIGGGIVASIVELENPITAITHKWRCIGINKKGMFFMVMWSVKAGAIMIRDSKAFVCGARIVRAIYNNV